MAEKKTKTFEDHCRRLDEIVSRLEDEQLPLEESIELFTEGVDLALKARNQLEQSGEKVQKLIEKLEGDFDLEDLDQEP
ncbi:MAG: exodeoxyribonuclease VII small subunit [Candidatus Glassbacteria bacterium RIFCSPLOWO2_12_FULL_58_11]|uniref:Exodeoxyribonuclease 7 small subunit n=2 Tax=Candidatus Glassiibacteriota TaxID=1817805 RepID=A0A1F5Z358_9BACT|nr:MAG: exodeoxyribonuclease VII small subunit [Candidatus Glassbacteria bacterium GWA2_58_10]OGG06871.1 MAG: exodeoxyribonuclease VII small subunit [Candidatus Glassbacteria bacterium RIFCSPLOWO2_12_FULL_58_11]